MQTQGEGVKKSKKFVDIFNGYPQADDSFRSFKYMRH